MRVGDVRPALLVGVDGEIVEQLAAPGAGDPALTHRAGMDRHELQGRRPAGRGAGGVLGEIHVPGGAGAVGAVEDEVDAVRGGHQPGEDLVGG